MPADIIVCVQLILPIAHDENALAINGLQNIIAALWKLIGAPGT